MGTAGVSDSSLLGGGDLGWLSLTGTEMLWIWVVLSLVSFGTLGMWDAAHCGPLRRNPDGASMA